MVALVDATCRTGRQEQRAEHLSQQNNESRNVNVQKQAKRGDGETS